MRSYREFHDPRFDEVIERTYEFAQALNPEVCLIPMSKITVVPATREKDFRQEFGIRVATGQFNPRSIGQDPINGESIFVIEEDTGMPLTDAIYLNRCLVHEVVHNLTTKHPTGYHRFYSEILAGFGEHAFMRHMQENGEFVPSRTRSYFELNNRDVLGYVLCPKETRSQDARESNGSLTETASGSAGAMGATAVEAVFLSKKIDVTGKQLIKWSKPGSMRGVNVVRYAMRSLDIDLVADIETCSQNNTGYLKASMLIQNTLRRQNTKLSTN